MLNRSMDEEYEFYARLRALRHAIVQTARRVCEGKDTLEDLRALLAVEESYRGTVEGQCGT